MVADSPALFNGLPVVLFQQAGVRIIDPFRQSGCIDEPEEQREIRELLVFHHLFEVEFNVCLLAQQVRIPEDA
jgi:hypothetical protein